MKKCLFVLLVLPLLLFSCTKEEKLPSFTKLSATSFRNDKTGEIYTALDTCFEAASAGSAVGEWQNEAGTLSLTFSELPYEEGMLCDENLTVYTKTGFPDPAEWKISAALFCIDGEVNFETGRLSADTVEQAADSEALDQLLEIWFEGEEVEQNGESVDFYRSVKLVIQGHPGLYYRFYFERTASACYFTQPETGRVVAVPQELADRIGGNVS